MHWTIRQTEQRQEQIRRIEEATGLSGYAAVVDFAVGYTIANLVERPKEKTMNRTARQVKSEMEEVRQKMHSTANEQEFKEHEYHLQTLQMELEHVLTK